MVSYFDELMQMWDKTTNEHVEWQRKRNTLSLGELFQHVQKLLHEADNFDEKTKHMKDENAGSHASILAAKLNSGANFATIFLN